MSVNIFASHWLRWCGVPYGANKSHHDAVTFAAGATISPPLRGAIALSVQLLQAKSSIAPSASRKPSSEFSKVCSPRVSPCCPGAKM
ncbi:TPA: hypothetical protein N0F65_007316 [Lagenidium giganteum]|uniref:Uncharacterized protein n=1 Tax=Lagenidium giganteum TaxID=4803 RepID=A0AAV2Z5Q0_9STRA|nr:TPA: hypothetical protein N0F65_007316 [Lagenidium giganteum]